MTIFIIFLTHCAKKARRTLEMPHVVLTDDERKKIKEVKEKVEKVTSTIQSFLLNFGWLTGATPVEGNNDAEISENMNIDDLLVSFFEIAYSRTSPMKTEDMLLNLENETTYKAEVLKMGEERHVYNCAAIAKSMGDHLSKLSTEEGGTGTVRKKFIQYTEDIIRVFSLCDNLIKGPEEGQQEDEKEKEKEKKEEKRIKEINKGITKKMLTIRDSKIADAKVRKIILNILNGEQSVVVDYEEDQLSEYFLNIDESLQQINNAYLRHFMKSTMTHLYEFRKLLDERNSIHSVMKHFLHVAEKIRESCYENVTALQRLHPFKDVHVGVLGQEQKARSLEFKSICLIFSMTKVFYTAEVEVKKLIADCEKTRKGARLRKENIRKAAVAASKYEKTMKTGTISEKALAFRDPDNYPGDDDPKISVAFSPDRLRQLLRGRFVIPLFGLKEGLIMPSWKMDLIRDIEISCMGGDGGKCLTFVFKASQIFCREDDVHCHANRLQENHAVTLFRELLGVVDGVKGFPESRFIIISGLTNDTGIDWSQGKMMNESGGDSANPAQLEEEKAQEAEISNMADVLTAICGCTSEDDDRIKASDKERNTNNGAHLVDEPVQATCTRRSSIFFDMEKRQHHYTQELFRKHMMDQMIAESDEEVQISAKQVKDRKQALAWFQTASLDHSSISETMETITCINILLQTGCGIHTIYFIGHYAGTCLIQKYIEGFYYGLYHNVEKMTMKKLSWATPDDLLDVVKFHCNAISDQGEPHQQQRCSVNIRSEAVTTRILEQRPGDTLEGICEDVGIIVPPQRIIPKYDKNSQAYKAWKNQLRPVETSVPGDARRDVVSGRRAEPWYHS